MAIQLNKIIDNLVFHSDRDWQCASQTYTKIIKNHKGIKTQSMVRKGNF
jgi:putative transposase